MSKKDDATIVDYVSIKRRVFEFQNPVYQLSLLYKEGIISIFKSTFELLNTTPSPLLAQKVYRKNDDNWQIHFKELINYELPDNLTLLLKSTKKNEQEKLLKNFTLSNFDFMAFVAQLGDKHAYKWSRYITEFRPKDLENKIYPEILYKNEDGEYVTKGFTNLTEAQLKVALNNRRYTIADILDKDGNWYCFFRTMSGLSGAETPHIGEPHYHYVSNVWGYTREFVVEQLKSYTHNLKSLHIKFDRDKTSHKVDGNTGIISTNL